jgi:hypothetical protein
MALNSSLFTIVEYIDRNFLGFPDFSGGRRERRREYS